MTTRTAPTAPPLAGATATRPPTTPNPISTPLASLAAVPTPKLRAALAEAQRDADVLSLGLRCGLATFRAAATVTELRGIRLKIGALDAELARRSEPSQ